MAKPGDFDFYCEEVLSGKTKVKKEYESETVLAFHHTKPSYETHIVIIPKEHIRDLLHIDKSNENVLLEIMIVARDIIKEQKWGSGMRLITNVGRYQDSKHLHFHMVGGKKVK